jgi:hypothetical protein
MMGNRCCLPHYANTGVGVERSRISSRATAALGTIWPALECRDDDQLSGEGNAKAAIVSSNRDTPDWLAMFGDAP